MLMLKLAKTGGKFKMALWRRFKPKLPAMPIIPHRGPTIYDQAEQLIRQKVAAFADRPKRLDFKRLDSLVDSLEHMAATPENPQIVIELAQLIARTPRAARAQDEMDRHHGGYRNRKARLYELIDFNDAFVTAVHALPDEELPYFAKNIQKSMKRIVKLFRAPMFSDRQFDAIAHGLSREIAVYRAAVKAGYEVRITDRVEDARGVDMVISAPSSGTSMPIDCKTKSSFHFRLLDLKRDGYLSEEQRLRAELSGFHIVRAGRQNQDFQTTTLLRISTQDLGSIRAYDFVDSRYFLRLLQRAMQAQSS